MCSGPRFADRLGLISPADKKSPGLLRGSWSWLITLRAGPNDPTRTLTAPDQHQRKVPGSFALVICRAATWALESDAQAIGIGKADLVDEYVEQVGCVCRYCRRDNSSRGRLTGRIQIHAQPLGIANPGFDKTHHLWRRYDCVRRSAYLALFTRHGNGPACRGRFLLRRDDDLYSAAEREPIHGNTFHHGS